MTTTLAFKDVIDIPEWRPLSIPPTAQVAGGSLCSDLRTSTDRIPLIYYLGSAILFFSYNYTSDGWTQHASPALAGFGAGTAIVQAPQRGPRGTIAAGASTTSFTLSTALPANVGINQLANRCDGTGHKVRIIDTTAGKTEERYIVGNTSGTTPVITVDPGNPFSFTPATGATYEFLSGRVYMLSPGVLGAGIWMAYDILTNSMLATLSTTNLPATITNGSILLALDELYCPNLPGEGFLLGTGNGGVASHALTATASSATTLTGQAAAGDATVAANEYRNFQIRIVKDTVTPTSVGQRRKITSHTGPGASPVYTVPTWTVTPSTSAQYVIENANEILAFTSNVATVYTYTSDIVGASSADSWSSTTYNARGAAMSAGCCAWQPFGMTLDVSKNARYSHVFTFRGVNTGALDVLDVAGGANGLWTNGITYGQATTFDLMTTGTCSCYDPFSANGYAYFNINASSSMYRLDSRNRFMESWASLRYTQSAAAGSRMATATFIDGATKVSLPTVLNGNSSNFNQTLAQR